MIENELIGNTINIITNLSFTFVILISIFIVFFIYAWRTSKGRSFALIIGIFVSGILFEELSNTILYKNIFSENIQGFILNTIIFTILIVVNIFIFKKFSKGLYSEERVKRLLQIGAFSLVSEGLFMTQSYRFLEIETFYDFPSIIDMIFGSKYSFLIWILITLALLLVTRSRK